MDAISSTHSFKIFFAHWDEEFCCVRAIACQSHSGQWYLDSDIVMQMLKQVLDHEAALMMFYRWVQEILTIGLFN